MFKNLHAGNLAGAGGALGAAVAKHATMVAFKTAHGSHSFSEEEKAAFTEHINYCLAGEPALPYLPLNPNSLDLFSAVRDGILLCKLINKAVPGTVDERALNIKKRELNIYEIRE